MTNKDLEQYEVEWKALLQKTSDLMKENNLDEAIIIANEALKLIEKHVGQEHQDFLICLHKIYDIHDNQGNIDESIEILMRLGLRYFNQHFFDKSENMYRKALKKFEDTYSPDDPYLSIILKNLANVYAATCRDEQAEKFYKKSLKLDEVNFGSDHPETITSLLGLGLICNLNNRLDEAEAYYKRLLPIVEKDAGPNSRTLILVLESLSTIYNKTQRYEEQKIFYQRALQIRENNY